MSASKSEHEPPAGDPVRPRKSALKRFAPLGIAVSLLAAFFLLGGPDYISLDYLREQRATLEAMVRDHTVMALLAFIAIYATLVAISFPGASLLSIFAGFLFGISLGTFAVVIGATLGAVAVFLMARSAFGTGLAAKGGPFVQKFQAGLKDNELSYLLILRLVPLFPFFIVNLVPALLNVSLRNYALSTFIGIIPGSLVYVSVGNGIGAALDAGEDVPLQGLMFQPEVILPVLGLILLSLLPIAYKHYNKKRGQAI